MGHVIAFPRREPDPAEVFDAYGNVRVAPGRVLTCGQASVTLAQAVAGAAYGWTIEPDSLSGAGRVTIFRARPRGEAPEAEPLACPGVSRDAEYPQAVTVMFSRPLTDDELRLFHDACVQAAGIINAVEREGRG